MRQVIPIGSLVRILSNRRHNLFGIIESHTSGLYTLKSRHGLYFDHSLLPINSTGGILDIKEKRQLLDSFAGKFVSVRWIKKDGSDSARVIQHMQHKMFTGGHASTAKSNPVAGKENYYTAVDVNSEKWINIDLNTLYFVSCGNFEANV